MRPSLPAFVLAGLSLVLASPGVGAAGPADAISALAAAFEARLADVPDPGTPEDAAARKALLKAGAALAMAPADLAAACSQAVKGAKAVAKPLAGDPAVDAAIEGAIGSLADLASTEFDAYGNAALESLSQAVLGKALKTLLGAEALLGGAADPEAPAAKRLALLARAAKKLASGRTALVKASGGPPVEGIGFAADDTVVTVFDLATSSVIQTVNVLDYITYDVVVDPASSRNRLYLLGNGSLITLDTRTMKVLRRDPYPMDHGTLQAVARGDRLYVTAAYSDHSKGVVFVRNLRFDEWESSIDVGYYSKFLAVDPVDERLWVNEFGTGSMGVVDLVTRLPLATIPVGQYPLGIALDPVTRRAFSVRNQVSPAPLGSYLMSVNMDTLAKAGDLWLGTASYGGESVATDPVRRRLFVANQPDNDPYGGNLVVLNLDGLSILGNVPVGGIPKDIAVDPATGLVYVTTIGGVSVVNPATLSVVATIAPSGSFFGISLARPGSGN